MAKFCIHCGEKISDTAAFCPFCGGKVSAVATGSRDGEDTRLPAGNQPPHTEDPAHFPAPSSAGEFSLDEMAPGLIRSATKVMASDAPVIEEAVRGRSFFGILMKLASLILSAASVYLGFLSKSLPVLGGTVAAAILSLILSRKK